MNGHRSTTAGERPFTVGCGPLQTEELLLAELDSLLDAAASEPRLLAEPVIVVVPSRSLRDHLAAALVRRRGGAVAGVEIVTLYGLALEIAARTDAPPPRGRHLFDLLVRRAARQEPALSSALDHLRDGYAAVAATVRDLLDAGFSAPLADAVLEQITELSRREGWGRTAERAAALVRVAAISADDAGFQGVEAPGRLFGRAVDALALDPAAVLPSRALLVHGFADATGCATDLLESLVRRCGARVFLDEPSDPANRGRTDLGVVFADRFTSRLGHRRRHGAADLPAPPASTIDTFRAPGIEAEVREVTRRVRSLLDGGASPERILLVARQLGPYVVPLRLHLRRLGVPFSGGGATAPGGAVRRRVAALTAIIDDGAAVATDRWLDGVVALPTDLDREARGITGAAAGPAPDLDLRIALRALGAGRLTDVAAVETSAVLVGGAYPLPLRRGYDDVDPGEEAGPRLVRRTLPGAALEGAVGAASSLLLLLRSWPEQAPVAGHLRRARALLTDHLGWRDEGADQSAAFEALGAIAAGAPAGLALEREEFALLLRRELDGRGLTPLGGNGGGVQILSVIEARGRTGEHLFLLGLNRDSFPRPVLEDPLLQDAFRGAMRAVLPDLPVKAAGHDEERYLFAQLLAAAPRVTLSWLSLDDDGRPVPPSPLVERLRLEAGIEEPPIVASLYAPPAAERPDGPRPAHEHAVVAGLYADRADFAAMLTVAFAAGDGDADLLARARLATLNELDPDLSTTEGARRRASLGPYFGFVGPPLGHDDPRRRDLPVTALESIASCPWQAFLRRLLRLEPPPDPLAALPGIDPLLLGNIVHGVLQRIATAPWGEEAASLDDAALRIPVRASWPEPAAFAALLGAEAARQAREHGVPWLAAPLAARARPYLELARELDWEEGGPPVVGAEVTGTLAVQTGGTARTVTFRADRVDRVETGLRLTDYKTGAPVADNRTAATRRKKLIAAVSRGDRLQAVAYALGAAPASGRYLFLKHPTEEWERAVREVVAEADDTALTDAFTAAASTVLAAWDLGAFLPRLLEPDLEHRFVRCQWCEVLSACLQQDSGARGRLARWVAARRESGDGGEPNRPGAVAWRIWALRERTGR